MHRGTAISALARILFLPVTYSMIFHRGAPNFSYAQEGADDNVSTLWIDDSSAVIVDVVEDDNTSTSWIADSSTMTIDVGSDNNVSVNGYTMNAEVDEGNNDTASWIVNSSTETIDLVESGVHLWTPDTNEALLPTHLDVFHSSSITIDDEEENIVSTTWIVDSSAVTTGVVEDNNVNPLWIADSSAVTIVAVEDNNVSITSFTVNIEVVEGSVLSWTPESNETSLHTPSDVLVLHSSTVNIDVDEGNISPSWIAISSTVIGPVEDNDVSTTTSKLNTEVVESSVHSGTPDANESSFPTPWDVLDLHSSTRTIDVDEDNNASTSWDVDSSTMAIDIIEDYNFSTSWVVDKSTIDAASDNSDSATSSTANVVIIEDKDVSYISAVDTEVVGDWNGTCRNGKMQSPIHITTFTAEVNPEAQPIIFVNYDLASLEAVVTAHTIKFDVKPHSPGYQIGIAGGGLMGFYELNHIHLHWSSSEHSIDLKAYKMEAHLVHFKTPHGNLTEDEVLDEPDGIAVLAVLFELGTADPIIEDLILNLGRNQTQAEMPKVMPRSFLPDNTDEYIRYRGSLTTPPCSEVVIWTIFPTPKSLTQYQVKWLSTRKLSEGIPDPENYRPVQNRNDREIVLMKASYTINIIPGRLEVPGSAASYRAPSIVLMLTAILCFSFRSC